MADHEQDLPRRLVLGRRGFLASMLALGVAPAALRPLDGAIAASAAGDAGASRNAILVGHSLVGPDLDFLIQQVAPEGARVQRQVINGAPLRLNWTDGATAEGADARAAIARGDIDCLVFTEAVPLQDQITWNDTYGFARMWRDAAVAANPAARVFLYETWHDIDASGGVEAWRRRLDEDALVWESIADHAGMARVSGGPVLIVPAGHAMGRLHDEIAAGAVPELASIRDVFEGGIHLDRRGMYYVAMLMVACLYGMTPVGLASTLRNRWGNLYVSLSPALARRLQELAWETAITHPRSGVRALRPGRLGIGLDAAVDWSAAQPFVDVLKCGREWIGHLPNQWGGVSHADLAAGGHLDADGWLVSIPQEVTNVEMLFLTEMHADAAPVLAGRYRLLYDGAGTIEIGGGTNVAAAPGRIEFDYAPTGSNLCSVRISAVDAGDPIRNMTCFHVANAQEHEAGRLFNPQWLGRVRGVPLVRFMTWQHTNSGALASWADRNAPSTYTWSRPQGGGAPVETMVALCNELLADPWFCMPHAADDDFVRAFAETVRDTLDPRLTAYVEYSNEVWNFQFEQAAYCAERAAERGWGSGGDQWMQWAGARAARMMDVWAEVFAGRTSRLVRVAAQHTGWKGLEAAFLEAPLAVAEGKAPPAASFDAYAVTGYFSAALGEEPKASAVRAWIEEGLAAAQADAAAQGLAGAARDAHVAAHRYDLASARCLQELIDGSVTGLGVETNTIAQLAGDIWPYHRARADAYGLRLLMYEGGSHVVGMGAAVEDEALAAFFQHFSYTPEMAAAYAHALRAWDALGGENGPFMQFVDVSRSTKWGSWGGLRHLRDANPRWTMLRRYNAGGPI